MYAVGGSYLVLLDNCQGSFFLLLTDLASSSRSLMSGLNTQFPAFFPRGLIPTVSRSLKVPKPGHGAAHAPHLMPPSGPHLPQQLHGGFGDG